jgi:hypothetical protein
MVKGTYRQLNLWSVTWPLGKDDVVVSKPDPDYRDLQDFLNNFCSKWCFHMERGANGNFHWQMQLSLYKKATKSRVIETFRQAFGMQKEHMLCIHVAPTNKNDETSSFIYSMKEDTRVSSIYYCDTNHYVGKDLEVFLFPRPFRRYCHG